MTDPGYITHLQDILDEVLENLKMVVQPNIMLGEVTYDPAALPDILSDLAETLIFALRDLEQGQYAGAYVRTLAAQSYGLYALLSLRACYGEQILTQVLTDPDFLRPNE